MLMAYITSRIKNGTQNFIVIFIYHSNKTTQAFFSASFCLKCFHDNQRQFDKTIINQ